MFSPLSCAYLSKASAKVQPFVHSCKFFNHFFMLKNILFLSTPDCQRVRKSEIAEQRRLDDDADSKLRMKLFIVEQTLAVTVVILQEEILV